MPCLGSDRRRWRAVGRRWWLLPTMKSRGAPPAVAPGRGRGPEARLAGGRRGGGRLEKQVAGGVIWAASGGQGGWRLRSWAAAKRCSSRRGSSPPLGRRPMLESRRVLSILVRRRERAIWGRGKMNDRVSDPCGLGPVAGGARAKFLGQSSSAE
jgi:hypothetical protein